MLLLAFASSAIAYGQATFVVVDESKENAERVAQYDRDVRKRIDFATLRKAVNSYIRQTKTISVGDKDNRYTVDLRLYELKEDWRLRSKFETVYVAGSWYWEERYGDVVVWFGDYSVFLQLTFQFKERKKCLLTDEQIADRREVIF